MAKVTQYRVLSGYIDSCSCRKGEASEPFEFEEIVGSYLDDGWKAVGGPYLIDDHNTSNTHLCGQAVQKKVKI